MNGAYTLAMQGDGTDGYLAAAAAAAADAIKAILSSTVSPWANPPRLYGTPPPEERASAPINSSCRPMVRLLRSPTNLSGNAVLYDSKSKPLWHTSSGGKANGRDLTFVIQNDRNLVLYADSEPLWCSKTSYDPAKATA
jgi:hypothetical protein